MAVARVFWDQDMRNGVDGFRQIMKKAKSKPKQGGDTPSFYMFVNRASTYVKFFADFGESAIVLSFRKDRGRLSMGEIEAIPDFIGGKNWFSSSVLSEMGKQFDGEAEVGAA